MTTPNTPQSTKKIEEILKDYNGYDFCGELSCSGQNKANELTQQLLTILKETCEAALPRKATIDKENEYIANYINIGFNQAIDQTKANIRKLIGEDNE